MSTIIHLPDEQGRARCGAAGCWLLIARPDRPGVSANPRNRTSQRRGVKYEPVPGNMIGSVFVRSYSYGDMTINEYGRVIAQTEKTLTLEELEARVRGHDGHGGGRSMPGQPTGKRLTLRARKFPGEEHLYWRGQGKSWREWDGQPDYYNTG